MYMLITLKSAVVKMWRPSGAQCTLLSPAEPSSILQYQSGFSMDHTCNKPISKITFLTIFTCNYESTVILLYFIELCLFAHKPSGVLIG